MAEFAEVIKQAMRMCNTLDDCDVCPLRDIIDDICPLVYICGEAFINNIGAMEKTVCDWVRVNPEPVYPSWQDGWRTLYPDAAEDRPPCPRYFMDEERALEYCNSRCEDCKHRPIPADIAEKLGIKPVGDK